MVEKILLQYTIMKNAHGQCTLSWAQSVGDQGGGPTLQLSILCLQHSEHWSPTIIIITVLTLGQGHMFNHKLQEWLSGVGGGYGGFQML